jgi:PAS domain S-box-containing protein
VEFDFQRALRLSLKSRIEGDQNLSEIIGDHPGHLLEKFNPGILYILDYKSQQYLYVNRAVESMLGYTREELMQRGIRFITERMHPADRKEFTTNLAEAFVRRVRQIKKDELHLHRFSYNFRLQRSDGNYVQTLTQFTIAVRDEDRNPMINIGTLMDITQFKRDEVIRMFVTRFSKETNSFADQELLFESGVQVPLSKRELEVLQQVAAGHSNEKISDLLSLSLYTIKAHRRNILRKTECKNFSQVISKARSNFWI